MRRRSNAYEPKRKTITAADEHVCLQLCRGHGTTRRPARDAPCCLFKSRDAPKALRRYPKAQITQERPAWFPKNASRCPKKNQTLSFVTSQTGDQWAVDAAKARHPST